MKFHAPGCCPFCGGLTRVETLKCERCSTRMEGRFELLPFHQLDAEEVQFLSYFLQYWGNLSRLARELGISYPTVRVRYRQILEKLGLEGTDEDPSRVPDPSIVLEALERGEITVAEAIQRLKGLLPEPS